MARKLKVFRTPAGFYDAYVAAPSRRAALEAWGSDADLFARGVAEEVTDPALMQEPLARPGEVVKRSRGTAAEQLAALPTKKKASAKKASSSKRQGEKPASSRPPKPSRDALAAAEAAVEKMEARHRAERRAIAERQAALERDRKAMAMAQEDESAAAMRAREKAEAAYDAALDRWRG